MTEFLIILTLLVVIAMILPLDFDPAIKLKEFAEQKAKDKNYD